MSDTVQRFNDIASDYDSFKRAIPNYGEMMDRILEVLTVWNDGDSEPRILELGSGTGELARVLVERFSPGAYLGLDGADAMVKEARERFSDSEYEGDVTFRAGTFQEWTPGGEWDWVISSLSVHHLSGEEKRTLFEKTYECLGPGGSFLLADLVSPPDSLRSFYRKITRNRLLERGFTESECRQHWKQHLKHDTPSPLNEQIRWLGEIGFDRRDCVWKDMNHAIMVARRPPESDPIHSVHSP